MKKIDLFNDKLKQKKVKELRESSNITETPHEEKGEMIGLTSLPPKQKKEKTYHTNRTERQRREKKQSNSENKPSEERHNFSFNYKH